MVTIDIQPIDKAELQRSAREGEDGVYIATANGGTTIRAMVLIKGVLWKTETVAILSPTELGDIDIYEVVSNHW